MQVRLGLTLLLWTVLVLYAIQPQWNSSHNTHRVLLVSENIPSAVLQKAKDSLKITESFSLREFDRRSSKDPSFADRLGIVYLLGQSIGSQTLSQLSGKEIHWIPSFKNDELQSIQWKAMLRKGELQEVAGKIELNEPKVLKIKYANQVIDSALLDKGLQSFRLRFPAFAIGRTETMLELGDQPLQKIAFYSRKPQPSKVFFILENPDFESKTLAEWLGKNGNRVEMLTTVAKNTQSKVSINQSKNQKPITPDIIITDPTNASHPLVKKAVADGKSVLFFNITNPEQAAKNVNAALGTKWRLKKISNEETVSVGNNVTALPYRLEENRNQRNIFGYPVAVQKTGGSVGLSLLNETFSLKLSGDSLAYGKIWSGILRALNPALEGNISAEAPLWQDTRSTFALNKFPQIINDLSVSQDTVFAKPSSLNTITSSADYIFRKSGWQPFQDSLEIYVEEGGSAVSKAAQIAEALRAHSLMETNQTTTASQVFANQLPDWAWMLLLLLCLTALWVEPKLRY